MCLMGLCMHWKNIPDRCTRRMHSAVVSPGRSEGAGIDGLRHEVCLKDDDGNENRHYAEARYQDKDPENFASLFIREMEYACQCGATYANAGLTISHQLYQRAEWRNIL